MADEDCDVFEISDFTNASDWEKFITQIEQVIRELKLTDQTAQGPLRKGELATNKWTQTKKQINFNKVAFVATKYEMVREEAEENDEYVDLDDKEEPMITALQDMMYHFNDFQSAGPPLSTWYGLRCFVVLNPSDEPVTMESKIKLLLSSVNIAIANTGCSVPIFVEAHHPSRNLHYGQCVSASLRTDFEMIHLQRIPRQYYHLNGLLDLFKAKLASPASSLPSVKLSAMLTYCLKDWKDYAWTHVPLDFDHSIDDDYRHPFGYLPMGACREPMSKLFLSTTWLGLSEEMIVDNDTYTDLDPLQAPMWSVLVKMADDPQCLLDECISKFQALCLSKETMEQLIGRWMEDEDQEQQGDVAQALNKLTEPVPYYIPTLSDVVNQATTRIRVRQRDPGLSINLLNDILMYLFPDAKEENKKDEKKPVSSEYKDILKHWKSAPLDSLTYKLALCLCIVNATYGGIRAVAHLWQEFVYEMRFRWENAILIPDISTDNPDLSTCLLHQKLQMLNCCIQKKQHRDARQHASNTVSGATTPSDAEAPSTSATESSGLDVRVIASSDSDDDFFECEESMETESENLELQSTDESKTSKDSVRFHKADGRKEPLDDNKLLKNDDLLYIPHTQDPAPLTEDMLDEQLEIMAKLGTSAEAAHRRALMQSGSLLSDMESFKAANPGCVLEDFVRWYSPRDYEVVVQTDDGQETKTGQLSARMRIPGNMWVDCWKSAKAVPCRRQKRLFNDTKEAEKVLHFLGNMRPAEVTCHLMPVVITAAVVRLLEVEKKERVPMTERLLKNVSVCSDRGQLMKEQNFLPMIRLLREVETSNARAHSLRTKFYEHLTTRRSSKVAFQDEEPDESPNPEIENLVCELVEGKEVPVVGAVRSMSGKILHSMFIASQRSMLGDEDSDQAGKPTVSVPDFPKPVAKQFILRCNVPRPAPYSRPSPQRLLCAISDHEVRFAGAFTIDTTFV